jgi:hypothetical protein
MIAGFAFAIVGLTFSSSPAETPVADESSLLTAASSVGRVGEYADYLRVDNGKASGFFRVTVLSEERADGGPPLRWVEFVPLGQPLALKVLMPSAGYEGEQPRSALLRLGTDVYELPATEKQKMKGAT